MRRALRLIAWLVVALMAFFGYSFLEARADPVVRQATVALPDWPEGAKPVRAVLISDIHMKSKTMDPERLTRIVGQINALHPDLVLIAGDFIHRSRPGSAAMLGAGMVGPLSALRAPLGTVAVLGNHDRWAGPETVRGQLAAAHVRVLDDTAVTAGPLVLGGIGDESGVDVDLPRTLAAVRALPGAHVLMTHSPDVAPLLPPDMPLLLAGHTHCGQIVLPFYGPLASVTRYGERYRAGVRRENARTVVVTCGLGTSNLPFRFGAPPDLWLITLGPGQ
jgi:predicted MPP superfamily phosphohydrolase